MSERGLYRAIDNPPEGTPLQFVGVYITRWRPEWGEPTIGFIEAEVEAETIAGMVPIPPVTDRISRVQSDLFAIREDLRDMLDDAKDARFVRLCAEIGALADEFLPEESEELSDEAHSELTRSMLNGGQ